MREMMKKTVLLKGLAAAVLSSSYLAAHAGNIALGREVANQACVACHGADGVKVLDPSYPMLAGQYDDFLARALTDYKSGNRKNAIMTGIASTLSKEDIANLAAYYSSLPGPMTFIRR